MSGESVEVSTAPDRLAFHQRLGERARTSGAGAAVELLYRAVPDGLVLQGPAGHAVVPTGRLPGAADLLPEPLRGDGLSLVRPGADTAWAERTDAVVWLRLGLSRALLDACLTHLEQRTVQDAPLLRQQLVGGALADAATEQTEAESVLLVPGQEPAMLSDLHRRITAVDRRLLRLLGAFGFTAEGPGRTALLSELIADVYAGHHLAEPEAVQ
ncbi:hypothetical protein [Streptomyces luteocolor]|uniref:hypothetical protein n=1 Tax=Streptomyces luteocolor TaxID=285500 RepID=UPI000AE87488|nr:hypothetical protein [Streptomyces luteocolor]